MKDLKRIKLHGTSEIHFYDNKTMIRNVLCGINHEIFGLEFTEEKVNCHQCLKLLEHGKNPIR
jgi:hypothetical protein